MCTVPKPYPAESRDDVVRVARQREDGVTLKQVAKDFGISESCLTNWLSQADRDAGVKPSGSSAPTDQAWIGTLFGHVKGECSHLEKTTAPGDLATELDRARTEYNTVRLHASIGYVTPDDEHEGRGDAIRKARRDGLDQARQERLDHHRRSRGQ